MPAPAALRDPLQALRGASVPALLLDAALRVLDANDAFVARCGRPREALKGLDLGDLQPPEDRDGARTERVDAAAAVRRGQPAPLLHQRLLDAAGQPCWYAFGMHDIAAPAVPARWLLLLQDVSAEFAAREQARRVQDELGQWFELARTGMLVYDQTGLIVRSNSAFEALVGRVPEVLDEAAPELQALLAWDAGVRGPALVPGGPTIEREALVPLPDGRRRRLSARLACWSGDAGGRRVMAVVEDRSAEDERDLAQLEIGMLMDTASVGVATFDPARGWLAPSRGAAAPAGTAAAAAAEQALSPSSSSSSSSSASGALLAIGRELVEPDSLPEYERLQRALRQGERTEVRYAVRHPELGARWLLTRVEPTALADGRSTTSVVTLDVTEQERSRRRSQQLLRELTTILDSSNAGIAYLRGPVLVRCNRRFERMLGFAPGAAAGATLQEILSPQAVPAPLAGEVLAALAEGRPFETELPLHAEGAVPRWVALSVRRAEPVAEPVEAVAVLTDVTRLKAQQSELEQLLHDREQMFNLSEVGIVYVRGARIERANQAMAALTGYAAPELTALDPAELYVDARECVDFEARIALGLKEAGRFVGERRLRRRDGSLPWVQVSVRPVAGDEAAEGGQQGAAHSGDGRAGGMIASFVDIDERRRARETLALQAERTRAVLNSVLVGIVTVGEHGIEWMNRSARRMFAGELADFVGEPIAIVATPEIEHPLRRDDWTQRLREGESETFECRLRGRDGREFWVVGNAVLSGGESGAPQITYALLDIERRRQAEISIAQAQASLQRVIETAPLAIALLDARTLRVLQVNQTAAGFFERAAERVLGATPEECFEPARAARLREWLAGAGASSEVTVHEWLAAPVAGSAAAVAGVGDGEGASDAVRVWDCRIAPLHNAGGDAEQLLLVASEVTERRQAEQARLQAAIAQREVLVREVHHRIKNNLQGVAGLLRQTAARQPEVAGALTEAVGQVQAIAQVYGLQVGSQGPLALVPLVEAIAQSVQRTFGRAIRVEAAALPHRLPEAEAIPVALTVNELLTNAVKHGQGGAEVRVSVEGDGEAARVCIANTGRLPPGFDLAQVRGGVSGLALVRALLPRRSATLGIEQRGDEVLACVELRAPSVRIDG